MSKVIVFGGSGFLGSHVADTLTEKGYEVVIYDRKPSQYIQKAQQMVVADILDQGKIRETIKGADYVYHFAGIADIDEAKEKPVDTVKYNVLGTAYIFDACVEFNVKRVLYASTVYVYSEHGSFYRSSKQASELFIENYNKICGLHYTILRYGSLYGKRANRSNAIDTMIRDAFRYGVIKRKGSGTEIREYINVLDAARASVEVLSEEFKDSYVILTGAQPMKVSEMLRLIKEIFNNQIEIEYLTERSEEHYEITPYSFRPRVAKKYLLQHYHDLGQGILECIYDICDQLERSNETVEIKTDVFKEGNVN